MNDLGGLETDPGEKESAIQLRRLRCENKSCNPSVPTIPKQRSGILLFLNGSIHTAIIALRGGSRRGQVARAVARLGRNVSSPGSNAHARW